MESELNLSLKQCMTQRKKIFCNQEENGTLTLVQEMKLGDSEHYFR